MQARDETSNAMGTQCAIKRNYNVRIPIDLEYSEQILTNARERARQFHQVGRNSIRANGDFPSLRLLGKEA